MFLDKLKSFARALGILPQGPKPFEPEVSTSTTSLRDLERPLDAIVVKRKLGPSYFTRRLNPRTRAARVRGLTRDERRLARAMGWIR